jgi:polysaccharide biosynthesis/export protein
MLRRVFKKELALVCICVFTALVKIAIAQVPGEPVPAVKRNSPYSPNPKKKEVVPVPTENAEVEVDAPPVEIAENTTSAKILKVISDSSAKSKPLTDTYRVGLRDVLLISFKSNKLQNTTYVTVLDDGTIDYPLAGGSVNVENTTLEEIQDFLREKVILKDNEKDSDNVELIVKVREAASHTVKVIGLVEKTGDKMIQRDAVPLFVIKAEAIVSDRANQVIIRRGKGSVDKFELKDPTTDDVLVYPNDIIEFVGKAESSNSGSQFYFVAGNVKTPGQKDFHDGITLTQAIYAAGGLKKESVRKVTIRRKNESGLLSSTEFDLRAIKDGKIVDPILQSGDLIEVSN